MELLSRIKAEMEAFEKRKQDLVKELRKEFAPMFRPIFDKHPKVESVSWTQFTCYFNDGDSTYFSVHNDDYSLNVNGMSLEDEDEVDPELESANEEFSEALGQISDDFYLDLFGDHKRVTLNRDGTIDIDNYEDHD